MGNEQVLASSSEILVSFLEGYERDSVLSFRKRENLYTTMLTIFANSTANYSNILSALNQNHTSLWGKTYPNYFLAISLRHNQKQNQKTKSMFAYGETYCFCTQDEL